MTVSPVSSSFTNVLLCRGNLQSCVPLAGDEYAFFSCPLIMKTGLNFLAGIMVNQLEDTSPAKSPVQRGPVHHDCTARMPFLIKGFDQCQPLSESHSLLRMYRGTAYAEAAKMEERC
jgi:hypothetical protein